MAQMIWDLGESSPVFQENPKPVDFANRLVNKFGLHWKLGETTGGFAPPVYFYDKDGSFLGTLAYVGHSGNPVIIVVIDAENRRKLTRRVTLDLGEPKPSNPRS